MSLTTTVPADVPLLFHNCPPDTKNSVPLTLVTSPPLIFVTFTVPALVPSLFHKPPWEKKNSVPLTFVNDAALLVPLSPGVISLTKTVPAAVPSLFQSSYSRSDGPAALTGSLAQKNNVPFTFVKRRMFEFAAPGQMSLTSTVPPAVPSLFHSS